MRGFLRARDREAPWGTTSWIRNPNAKAGRHILASTAILALVASTTGTAGAADETNTLATEPGPDSSPSPSQWVEVREAGYAMSFPEDWVVEIVEEGSDTAILVLSGPERFGPDVELQNLLVAWGPEGHERDTLNVCTLVRYEPIELTAEEFLQEIHGQNDSIVVESLDEGLSRVLVNPFFQSRILSDQPKATYAVPYAISADGVVAILWCSGVASHLADWQSIAESFVFLPE